MAIIMACVGICMICFITGTVVTGLVNMKTVSNGYQILPGNGSKFMNISFHNEYSTMYEIMLSCYTKYLTDMVVKNNHGG